MGYSRKHLTWFFVIVCILALAYVLRLKFISYYEVWHPDKGVVVVLNGSNANFYNAQDISKKINLDLSMLNINGGIITDVFLAKDSFFVIQKVQNGKNVEWYLTNIFDDRIEKTLIYIGEKYHIFQVWNSNESLILNTSEGYYRLNLKSGRILKLDNLNNLSYESLVYSEWPEEELFTNQSFGIDYSKSEIYNLLSRRLKIHGIVDNIAIVQILPNTSNDEFVSLNAFFESLRFNINAATFSTFYLNLKEIKFLKFDLCSDDNHKWYMNIKYLNTDYNEKILTNFQTIINHQDNIPLK